MRWLVALLILVGACGASNGSAGPRPDPGPPAEAQAPGSSATGPLAALPEGLTPGAVSTIRTALAGGTELVYAVAVPADFDQTREYPVVLALPPGGQDVGLTVSIAQRTYAPEALARNWVVVSPAAPNGRLFFQGSEALIPEFLDTTLAWLRPEDGRVHLAGISNGGISAFRIAALYPDRVASLVVLPGFARSPEDQAALVSFDFPIAMYVGGNDSGWIDAMQTTVDLLTAAGKDVSFEIRGGEDHVIGSLMDGSEIFEFLDAARSSS